MKQTILLHLFFIASIGYSQVDSINFNLNSNTIDSIQFSIWNVHNKEMSIPDQYEEEKDYENKIKQVILNKKNQQLFITNLQNPKSYDQTRALPYHYNLVFLVYKKGIISAEIRVSTMTGNIDIDTKLTETNFKNNCSEQMGEVLTELLKKYNFFELFDEVELEGITPWQKQP